MVVLLLLGLATAVVPAAWAQQPCRVTRQGQDSGLVRVPDFGHSPLFNVSCQWSYVAQNNRKILVRVDSVHYPPDETRESSLRLVLDDEIVDIPRNCVRCLKENFVSAGNVQILYKSLLTEEFSVDESPSEAATTEVGSFQVRYKVFDPTRCDSPKQPLNGFAMVSSRSLGDDVVYGCKTPYDLIGSDRAYCLVKDDLESPVPEWSSGPPKCVVSNCSATLHRAAGNGAVSSPGYPSYVVPPSMDCSWVLQAEPGSHIRVVLTFLQLSDKSGSFGTLSLYEVNGTVLGAFNETRNESLILTTISNELTVNFVTVNSQAVKGGFFLEYHSIRNSCAVPSKPVFGAVVFTNLSVGSVSNFTCSPGYELLGESSIFCRSNRTWSAAVPKCVSLEEVVFPAEHFTSSPQLSSSFSQTSESTTVIQSTVKFTKSSKKGKVKPTEKTFLKTSAKSKVSNSSKFSETGGEGVTASDAEATKEQKVEGKGTDNVNSAQDTIPKDVKKKDNSTFSKQKSVVDSVQVQRHQDVPKSFPVPDPNGDETKMLDVLQEEEQQVDERILGLKGYIIIGVASALLLVILCVVVAMVVYKKRFPVRMRFGRRFSTFENPIYVTKDAQHSRELKRLTV